jgi:hypothetical protein
MNQWDTADLTHWIHYFSSKGGNKSNLVLLCYLTGELMTLGLPDTLVENLYLSIRPFVSPDFPVVSTSSIEQSFFRFLLKIFRYVVILHFESDD